MNQLDDETRGDALGVRDLGRRSVAFDRFRKLAERNGYEGRPGGWIYDTRRPGAPAITQGWQKFALYVLNQAVRFQTAAEFDAAEAALPTPAAPAPAAAPVACLHAGCHPGRCVYGRPVTPSDHANDVAATLAAALGGRYAVRVDARGPNGFAVVEDHETRDNAAVFTGPDAAEQAEDTAARLRAGEDYVARLVGGTTGSGKTTAPEPTPGEVAEDVLRVLVDDLAATGCDTAALNVTQAARRLFGLDLERERHRGTARFHHDRQVRENTRRPAGLPAGVADYRQPLTPGERAAGVLAVEDGPRPTPLCLRADGEHCLHMAAVTPACRDLTDDDAEADI
jgi:hypothetical protein